ncbi:uncharacterized protein L201_004345 [Kwoniella dendrophila CBS 6074]|uniref:NmrA-like domain-containing protein n=1 Tax=Kwoniella dendrophila CBS 6074 TaxID=1295534 RepID=A0AAX4JVX1_9TREE
MSRSILVTGATGKQGGALIEHLISKSNDFTILAVTRDAKSPSANRLSSKSPSIKLVQGDLEYPIELFKAAKEVSPNQKIWGVFSVQAVNFKGGKIEDAPEVKQGISLVDESLKNNVEQFVYSSVDRGGSEKSWNNPTNVPHFATKNMIEQHLKKSTIGSSMKWSILRPVIFMDNLEPGFQSKVFMASLRDTMKEKKNVLDFMF